MSAAEVARADDERAELGGARERTIAEARRRRVAFSLYGVSTFLSFPHELPVGLAEALGRSSFDFGIVFAWLAPAALVVGLEGLAPRRAVRLALLASLATHTVFFHWFMIVTLRYGGMPLLLGVFAPLAPAFYVALFTALFAAGWSAFARATIFPSFVGALLWVAVDWLRGHFLGGFPWATLGYALHLDTSLLGWTRALGVYGLSFWAALVGIAIARLWLAPRAAMPLRALAIVAGLVLAHGLGWLALPPPPPLPDGVAGPDGEPMTRRIRVAAIQGNIDQGEKWEDDRRTRILETYLRLSEAAAAREVDWIVWPETAVPGLLEHDPGLRSRLGLLARRHAVSLVVGGMGAEIDETGQRYSAFYDSAFVFDPEGRMRDRYDKTHLVPFGEFVPLRGLFGRVFQSLARGLASNDVTPGERPRNLQLANGVDRTRGAPAIGSAIDLGTPESAAAPDASDAWTVGVPICYELLFPHLVRRFADQGASVLLAITNDAWYGRTGAPHQFLAMTSLRAAENGLPIVRAANTGISAIIDARGRVGHRSALFEEAIVVGEIEVPRESRPTFYARHGDVFAGACVAIVLVLGVFNGVGRRRETSQGGDHGA